MKKTDNYVKQNTGARNSLNPAEQKIVNDYVEGKLLQGSDLEARAIEILDYLKSIRKQQMQPLWSPTQSQTMKAEKESQIVKLKHQQKKVKIAIAVIAVLMFVLPILFSFVLFGLYSYGIFK